MYYYGNSYGYGNTGSGSCGAQVSPCGGYGNYGFGSGYAIILVLFILLIIILGARGWN